MAGQTEPRLGKTHRIRFIRCAAGNPLWAVLGWTLVGGIPNYATDTSGAPERNAIYYKLLG